MMKNNPRTGKNPSALQKGDVYFVFLIVTDAEIIDILCFRLNALLTKMFNGAKMDNEEELENFIILRG